MEGGVGIGGLQRKFAASTARILYTRIPALGASPSFPSVNHRFEAVRLAKRLMCVAETREPPSPHPAKRRFRIFRTATRSGGMLILSVDRPPPPPTSEYFPTTLNALFVERVSKGEGRVFEHVFDALDFFSFFKFIERYSFDKFITLSYINTFFHSVSEFV